MLLFTAAKIFPCNRYGLLPVSGATMKVSIHEDYAGALVLAETLLPQFTPWSKHYTIKTIWFREQIDLRGIKLVKIDNM